MTAIPSHRVLDLPALLAAVAALTLVGCPTTNTPTDAGGPGTDAGRDAGTSPMDAGGRDAGAPDAGPPECEVGAMRTADCGFCGTESQRCEAPGTWVSASTCIGQGECAGGSVENRDLAMCEVEQRICLDTCTWSDWEPFTPPGECEVDETRTVEDPSCAPDQRLRQTCTASCEWPTTGTCVSACDWAPARTTPEWKREVCVPSGDFIRGQDGTSYGPAATIFVSSFYIDVYPVTNRRYNECVTAGVCAVADGMYARTTPEFLDHPVQGISRNEAAAFCTWDGGRRFVTIAEWQKAARGPAPRSNIYPWGNTIDCSIIETPGDPCYDPDPASTGYARDPYDAFGPAVASYYGVQMMGFGMFEWALDYRCSNYFSAPEFRVPDPVCRDATRQPVIMSNTRQFIIPLYVAAGTSGGVDNDGLTEGVRCGHSRSSP
ncbi:MAG: formylglycine-generating enzyme family protein [Sandaracinaceae bacterium]